MLLVFLIGNIDFDGKLLLFGILFYFCEFFYMVILGFWVMIWYILELCDLGCCILWYCGIVVWNEMFDGFDCVIVCSFVGILLEVCFGYYCGFGDSVGSWFFGEYKCYFIFEFSFFLWIMSGCFVFYRGL